MMWLLYLYLIRDGLIGLYAIIVAPLATIFGEKVWMDSLAISNLPDTLKIYGIVALANGVVLICWARYNQYFRSGPDHLETRKLVSVADLAARYGLPGADVAKWQQARILVMRHSADGTLSEVVVRDEAP